MNKLNCLEGARGYMALWVFFTHALTLATFNLHKEFGIGCILVNGFWPVSIFILLSGFVTGILLEKKETYYNFLYRRFFRLFPIYIVCLIISILMLSFTKNVLSSISWDNPINLGRIHLIEDTFNSDIYINILSHVLLLHGIIPNNIIPTSYTLMGQSWSLTLEWQFYLIIPFLNS